MTNKKDNNSNTTREFWNSNEKIKERFKFETKKKITTTAINKRKVGTNK
jgi:hypothetical protein